MNFYFLHHAFHRHHWISGQEGLGLLPKANTPYPTALPGHEEHCDCGAKRFQAHIKGSHPVEVVE